MTARKGIGFLQNILFSCLAIITVLIPLTFQLGRLNLLYSVLFFWLLADPQRLVFNVIFLLAILQDLINHTFLGLHASLYAVFMVFIISQRRQLLNRSFFLTWAAFSTSLFTLLAIKSFLGFVFYRQLLTVYEFFLEDIFPILLFPLTFYSCAFLYTRILPKDA